MALHDLVFQILLTVLCNEDITVCHWCLLTDTTAQTWCWSTTSRGKGLSTSLLTTVAPRSTLWETVKAMPSEWQRVTSTETVGRRFMSLTPTTPSQVQYILLHTQIQWQMYTRSHRGCTSFLVQRQSRRISMQILGLSHQSLRQITDKLCAAINQSESYRAHTAKTATPHLYHFSKNDRGHLQPKQPTLLFPITHGSCVA